MNKKQQRNILILLQIATATVFLGRAWQHLFWDAPYRTLLWDEGWMKGIVELLFGMPWEEYITSMSVDKGIQSMIKGTGVFYLICALIALFVERLPKWTSKVLLMGAASLLILAALYCKEKFFSVGQFLEYSLQVGSPLFLYAVVRQQLEWKRLLLYMKVALALTFVCHGLYAVNYYPLPGIFVEMMLNTLGASEATTYTLLNIAGVLDFVISIMIFLPFKYAQPAVLYAALWGLATALARIVSFFDFEYVGESLHQWMHEMMYRFPHFLIPLAIWLLMRGLRGVEVGKRPKEGIVVR